MADEILPDHTIPDMAAANSLSKKDFHLPSQGLAGYLLCIMSHGFHSTAAFAVPAALAAAVDARAAAAA